MVTLRNRRKGASPKLERRPLYAFEWRKFTGTKPTDLADALGIERQSYHRLEKNWWTISAGEMDIIAKTLGIRPSQLWAAPPKPGQQQVSLDEWLEDMPETKKEAAIAAVRGIAGL